MRGKERLLNYIAWGGAGLVILSTAGLIAIPLLAPVATSAVGMYTSWLQGYEPGCTAQTIFQAVSPSGRWTVRIRHGNCADFGSGPWLDVVLASNERPRFLAPQQRVFYRDRENPTQGSGELSVKWVDDHTLEIDAPPCAPSCDRWDEQSKTIVPSGYKPCERECWSTSVQGDIAISVRPPEH